LEFIYGEEETEVEPEGPPVIPPPDILSELIELTHLGDIAALQQVADNLEQDDLQLAPFAAKLQYFIDSFQINQLLSFLESQRGE
jgi:hypothetical protein